MTADYGENHQPEMVKQYNKVYVQIGDGKDDGRH